MPSLFRKNSSEHNLNSRPIPVVMMGVLELWTDRGASIHMRELALGLSKQGFFPWVICLSSPTNSPAELLIKELVVPVIRKRFLLQLSWNFLATARAIEAVCKSGSSIIYTRLDPGMFAGLLAAVITRSKLVIELNGLPTVDLRLYRPNNKFLLAISHLWEALHYRVATVIVGAPGYAKFVRQHFVIPKKKLHISPLGVNTAMFRPMEKVQAMKILGISTKHMITWIGTLAGWQGLEVLLHASVILREKIPYCRVQIVGDGPDLPKLKRLAILLRLQETVCFVGKVPYKQIPVYIGASCVCVGTFPGNRGNLHTISALKILNYLACGRPVVTNEMDEMASDIVQAEAGFSVHPDDDKALASALATLLTEDTAKWKERCNRAKALIDRTRTWTGIAEKIAQRIRVL